MVAHVDAQYIWCIGTTKTRYKTSRQLISDLPLPLPFDVFADVINAWRPLGVDLLGPFDQSACRCYRGRGGGGAAVVAAATAVVVDELKALTGQTVWDWVEGQWTGDSWG